MKVAGIITLIVGVALTIFTSIHFFTKEKVVDLGKIEITKDKPHHVSWTPLIGVIIMGAGGFMLWQGAKK